MPLMRGNKIKATGQLRFGMVLENTNTKKRALFVRKGSIHDPAKDNWITCIDQNGNYMSDLVLVPVVNEPVWKYIGPSLTIGKLLREVATLKPEDEHYEEEY